MSRFWEKLAALALNTRQQTFGRIVLPILLVVALIASYFFGAGILTLDSQGDVEHLLAGARDSVWAPLAVFAVFTIVGFTGFPQFMLMAAAVVMFGPAVGFLYSWAATVVSSCAGFWAGHAMGSDLLRRFGGARLNWLSEQLGRRGILASALMRIVPLGPFVMVNLIAGASHISFAKFLIGSSLGTVPKAGLMAFVGASLFEFLGSRDPRDLVLLGLAVTAWTGLMVFAGRWFRRRRENRRNGGQRTEDAAPAMGTVLRPGGAPEGETS